MTVPFYLSNPQTKSQSSASKLANDYKMFFGGEVSVGRNGQYYIVDKDSGIKVQVEDSDTIWDIKAKIDNAKKEAKNTKSDKSDNILAKWAKQDKEAADNATKAGKEADRKENFFAELIRNTKHKLSNVFHPYKKYNVEKGKDLSGIEANTLVEKSDLHDAIEDANKYEGDIAEYKKQKLHYNLEAHSQYSTAFMRSCSAMKFSSMA